MQISTVDRTDIIRVGIYTEWGLPAVGTFVITVSCLMELIASVPHNAILLCAVLGSLLTTVLGSVRRPGRLRFDRTGLTWNSRLLASRAQIVDVQRRDAEVDVLIDSPLSLRLRFRAPDSDIAEDLCKTLRGGDRPPATVSHVTSRMGGSLWRAAMTLVGSVAVPAMLSTALGAVGFGRAAGAFLLLIPVLVFVAMVTIMSPTKLVIGSDGALLKWLGTSRWIPWNEVATVDMEPTGSQLLLSMKDGRRVEIPCRGGFGVNREDTFLGPSLYERVTAQLSRAGAQPNATSSMLERNGRTGSDWLESLIALGGIGAGHIRQLPVSTDALRRVLDDLSASESLRMAASVVLGAMGDRNELKIRAATVASPRLRVVMEAASYQDPDRAILTRALDEVEVAQTHLCQRERSCR